MLYGCETWNLHKAKEEELRLAECAVERAALKISLQGKIANEEIRRRGQFSDIVAKYKKRKIKAAIAVCFNLLVIFP